MTLLQIQTTSPTLSGDPKHYDYLYKCKDVQGDDELEADGWGRTATDLEDDAGLAIAEAAYGTPC